MDFDYGISPIFKVFIKCLESWVFSGLRTFWNTLKIVELFENRREMMLKKNKLKSLVFSGVDRNTHLCKLNYALLKFYFRFEEIKHNFFLINLETHIFIIVTNYAYFITDLVFFLLCFERSMMKRNCSILKSVSATRYIKTLNIPAKKNLYTYIKMMWILVHCL